jgi:DNA-damage-inducible protein J
MPTVDVRARVDAVTKKEAEAVLKPMGLTTADAIRMMIVQIAKDKALPFEPFMPNEETIAAIQAARRGEVVKVGTTENLFADLHADD